MTPLGYSLLVLLLALIAWLVYQSNRRELQVPDMHVGLLFQKGLFQRVLSAGNHKVTGRQYRLELVDLRQRVEVLAGQEVMTADGAPAKISFIMYYRIVDALAYRNQAMDARQAFYFVAQAALRDAVARREMEGLLTAREQIAAELKPRMTEVMQCYGMELDDLFIRDLMLAGPLRSIFTRVLAARREGQIALEKARAESAAIRSLLNTARLLERNPQLMQLRLLQAMKDSTGNTFILKLPASPELAASAEDVVQTEVEGDS